MHAVEGESRRKTRSWKVGDRLSMGFQRENECKPGSTNKAPVSYLSISKPERNGSTKVKVKLFYLSIDLIHKERQSEILYFHNFLCTLSRLMHGESRSFIQPKLFVCIYVRAKRPYHIK